MKIYHKNKFDTYEIVDKDIKIWMLFNHMKEIETEMLKYLETKDSAFTCSFTLLPEQVKEMTNDYFDNLDKMSYNDVKTIILETMKKSTVFFHLSLRNRDLFKEDFIDNYFFESSIWSVVCHKYREWLQFYEKTNIKPPKVYLEGRTEYNDKLLLRTPVWEYNHLDIF